MRRGCCGPPAVPRSARSPPPLLLLQVVVASLLALEVQFGVLQLRGQALALLLQLLQRPLALLAVCLQVRQLRAGAGRAVRAPGSHHVPAAPAARSISSKQAAAAHPLPTPTPGGLEGPRG